MYKCSIYVRRVRPSVYKCKPDFKEFVRLVQRPLFGFPTVKLSAILAHFPSRFSSRFGPFFERISAVANFPRGWEYGYNLHFEYATNYGCHQCVIRLLQHCC
jgi:hypothetical protein